VVFVMSVLLIRVVRSTTAQLSYEGGDPHPTGRAALLPFRYSAECRRVATTARDTTSAQIMQL
jgi:hypothetical protein